MVEFPRDAPSCRARLCRLGYPPLPQHEPLPKQPGTRRMAASAGRDVRRGHNRQAHNPSETKLVTLRFEEGRATCLCRWRYTQRTMVPAYEGRSRRTFMCFPWGLGMKESISSSTSGKREADNRNRTCDLPITRGPLCH